eukprot:scaffold121121_cov66-Phaeocystis_antarctica.AAC.1
MAALALVRARSLSRGRAPRPRAAASADAPASPIAPAPSPSTSRCTPSGPAAPELSWSVRCRSAGSTDPSVPSVARSVAERPLSIQRTSLASRSSLQLRIPSLRHNAAASS